MPKPTVTVTRLVSRDYPELFVRFEVTEGLGWVQVSTERGPEPDVTLAKMRSHVALLEGSGRKKTVKRYY